MDYVPIFIKLLLFSVRISGIKIHGCVVTVGLLQMLQDCNSYEYIRIRQPVTFFTGVLISP